MFPQIHFSSPKHKAFFPTTHDQIAISDKKKKHLIDRWFYLQNRNADTDVENKCMDTKEEKGNGMIWEVGIDMYILLCVK